MAVSDPIADFLTRIRNGQRARHRFVDVPWAKMKENLADILKKEGFIENYIIKKEGTRGTMRVFLKYDKERKPIIQGIRRQSKPGLRRYSGYQNIKPIFGGMGIAIFSTSQGLMSGQDARKQKVGGELLCTVW